MVCNDKALPRDDRFDIGARSCDDQVAFIGAVVYLYLQGQLFASLGLALFGIATIILVDNILTSYFFGKGLEVSSIFVLFSILGGIVFFGPLGFILGPLVLSVFLSTIHVYGPVEHERIASS